MKFYDDVKSVVKICSIWSNAILSIIKCYWYHSEKFCDQVGFHTP